MEPPAPPPAPSREPGKPLVSSISQPEIQPARVKPAERPTAGTSSDQRGLKRIIGIVIAALALLGLFLFIGRDQPTPAPKPVQETENRQAPEKTVKERPPVRDVKIKEAAPVGKPSSPFQPPD